MPEGCNRNADRSWTVPPSKKNPEGHVPQQFSDELEDLLTQSMAVLDRNETVTLIFEDMESINDHFQAAMDWFKARGKTHRQRYEQGVFMKDGGVLYFVAWESNQGRPIRGVEETHDVRPFASELVRETGLEARLRKAGAI